MTARMTAPARVRPAAPSEIEARPDLRVVGPAERTPAAVRRQARLLAIVAVTIAAGLLFGLVATHVAITQRQFQLEGIEQRADELQADYDRLRLEVAELESPARIVAAGQALGLEQPTDVTYLTPAPNVGRADPVAPEHTRTSTSWQTVKPHLADH